jgi:hypothetical protein
MSDELKRKCPMGFTIQCLDGSLYHCSWSDDCPIPRPSRQVPVKAEVPDDKLFLSEYEKGFQKGYPQGKTAGIDAAIGAVETEFAETMRNGCSFDPIMGKFIAEPEVLFEEIIAAISALKEE